MIPIAQKGHRESTRYGNLSADKKVCVKLFCRYINFFTFNMVFFIG
jgi:hypothetical protein